MLDLACIGPTHLLMCEEVEGGDQGPHWQGIGADIEPAWSGQTSCGRQHGLGLWASGNVTGDGGDSREEGWAWPWEEALCLLLSELTGVSACGI